MHYDAAIIGASMSGLAAGIRLAHFDRRVCILERHYAYGGLNSYYTLAGRQFDVGLHALTNFAPPEVRAAPLNKLLRQLRLSRDEFALSEQRFSEIRFPSRRLRFTNDVRILMEELRREFPREIDRFGRLVTAIQEYDELRFDHPYRSAREVLGECLRDPVLIEMLLCPAMYYGNAREHDMDYTQFVILFKSLFLEGFARPRGGVRTIIKTLVKRFRACGGKIKMRCGVESIDVRGSKAIGLTLAGGETITADIVFSSAGYVETMELCSDNVHHPHNTKAGEVSFVESIAVLDALPQTLGHEAAIVFFNDADRFRYQRPREPVDLQSGVLCCPSNFERHDDMAEGILRVTWLANHDRWGSLDDQAYTSLKHAYREPLIERATEFIPGFREHVVLTDTFTPRTIERFTGHIHGAVYGTPRKTRDGRTRVENLFICGTDQGYLGIIGAMLSGITMANLHGLS